MNRSKKTFLTGLNFDDSFYAHRKEDTIDALNAKVVTSDEGKAGSLSNVFGNRLVSNQFLDRFAFPKVIGTYEDSNTNDLYYFIKDDNESYIFKYDVSDNFVYLVLRDQDFNDGYTLNFSKSKPVTGVYFVDKLLYWTGPDEREPSRINVDRGIKMHHSGYTTEETAYTDKLSKHLVTVIRKPPMLPLVTEAQEDTSRDTTFLKSRSLTFAYRYIYKDGETSVFSPSSDMYPNQDVDNANHKTTKKIKVSFPFGEAETYGISDDIDKVQFSVKFDNDTSYFIWKEFDRDRDSGLFANQKRSVAGVLSGDFHNDVLGRAVSDSNSIKLYDTVPTEAQALTVARNRLFLGNFKEGRVNPRSLTASDMTASVDRRILNTSTFNQTTRNDGGTRGFSSSSAYQVGIAFYDFAGRSGGVLTNDSLKVVTQERTLALYNYNKSIKYSFGQNFNTAIPDWATHYSILRTKNLTKDFSLTNLIDSIRYYRFDSSGSFTVNVENVDENGVLNGSFSENEYTDFSPDHEGVAIGLGDLTSFKQGYSFQNGDRVKVLTGSDVYEFAITGVFGKYVTVNLVDLNGINYFNVASLANKDYKFIYEIYSPHKQQENEFFYEAKRYKVVNPGLSNRSLQTLHDDLRGDVYLKSRDADTSTVEPFTWESEDNTANDNEQPIKNASIDYVDNASFYGSGLNDAGSNAGVTTTTEIQDKRIDIKITSTSTNGDKIKWAVRSRNQRMNSANYSYGGSSGTTIVAGTPITLLSGVTITFDAATGHTLNDRWTINLKTESFASNSEMEEHTYQLYSSPPNGIILAGSKIDFSYYEKKKRNLASDQTIEFDFTTQPSDVSQNYNSLEELFWETSFGSSFNNRFDFDKIYFRRGTVTTGGNGGKNQIYILNTTADTASATWPSGSDVTAVHVILKSNREQDNETEGRVSSKGTLKIDEPDDYSYSTELMNPSDDYFLNWVQITGRPNLVPDDVSSQNKVTGITFSETKIPGSKVNGLSKFSALDEDRLDEVTGPIRKLTLTTKTQSTGTVMLAISENESTAIYLGESQLQGASSGNEFLSVSKSVIGTKNTLQGSFGTINPESVVTNEGRAFWFDAKNSTVVRYTGEGLMPIGDLKMKTYFREKAKEVFRNNTIVPATFDDFNNEYIITFPSHEETTIVLQQDAEFELNPSEDFTNPANEALNGTIPVSIISPWGITKYVQFTNGVGTIVFDSEYKFQIPSNFLQYPTGNTTITVANSTGTPFTTSTSGGVILHSAGTGGLTVSNVFDDVAAVILNLTRVNDPLTGDIVIELPRVYTETSALEYSYEQGSNPTPLLFNTNNTITTDDDIHQATFSASNGSVSIPLKSNGHWGIGVDSPNDGCFYVDNETFEDPDQIPIANLVVGGAQSNTDSNGNIIAYDPSTFTVTVSGIEDNINKIILDSRPRTTPLMSTSEPSGLSQTGVTLNASILNDGAGETSAYGFVWSLTNADPTISDSSGTTIITTATSLSGSVSYSTDITGLTAGDLIYYQAYVTTDLGTFYSGAVTHETASSNVTAPSVTTGSFNASDNSITGTVTANGGDTAGTNGITEMGFVYSTVNTIPALDDSSGTTSISNPLSNITGFPHIFKRTGLLLISSSTYYFRAYAKNSVGTAYGSVTQVTTAAPNGFISGVQRIGGSLLNQNGGTVTFRFNRDSNFTTATGTARIKVLGDGNPITTRTVNLSVSGSYRDYGINIPINPSSSSITLSFQLSSFSPSSLNGTGQTLPLNIPGGTVQQAGTGGPGTP
jgi:hypothetical protein